MGAGVDVAAQARRLEGLFSIEFIGCHKLGSDLFLFTP
jgi:hypothetical protein